MKHFRLKITSLLRKAHEEDFCSLKSRASLSFVNKRLQEQNVYKTFYHLSNDPWQTKIAVYETLINNSSSEWLAMNFNKKPMQEKQKRSGGDEKLFDKRNEDLDCR